MSSPTLIVSLVPVGSVLHRFQNVLPCKSSYRPQIAEQFRECPWLCRLCREEKGLDLKLIPVGHRIEKSEDIPSNTTVWIRAVKKLLIQAFIFPPIPYHFNFSSSLLWPTLSNALEKSSIQMSVCRPFSMFLVMSFINSNNCVSQDLLLRSLTGLLLRSLTGDFGGVAGELPAPIEYISTR